MNNDLFYRDLSVQVLEAFATKTFGVNSPSDLDEILLLLKPGQNILEIGAGTGRIGIELIKRGFNYFGVEKQKKYLQIFKTRLKNEKIDNSRFTLKNISFGELDSNLKFDRIIFSWSVIGDFSKREQMEVLKKSYIHLTKRGICLLDNPSKNQVYNQYGSYSPTLFYYDEWKDNLTKIGFSHYSKIYTTKTGTERELTVLKK